MNTIQTLQENLKKFGLNPNAWEISQKESNRFVIRKKRDRSFTFVGWVTNDSGRPQWSRIQLLSI